MCRLCSFFCKRLCVIEQRSGKFQDDVSSWCIHLKLIKFLFSKKSIHPRILSQCFLVRPNNLWSSFMGKIDELRDPACALCGGGSWREARFPHALLRRIWWLLMQQGPRFVVEFVFPHSIFCLHKFNARWTPQCWFHLPINHVYKKKMLSLIYYKWTVAFCLPQRC